MLIKVCGMRQPENIRQVAAAGADWMGFIFYTRSPRFAGAISSDEILLAGKATRVGVFVDASPEYMLETGNRYKLGYLQLHGNESPEVCHTLQKRGYGVIKAFAVEAEEDLIATASYEGRADYFLFDTRCNGYGGSGKQFDWSVLAAYKGDTPFLLSGGIGPDSLEAIRHFRHPLLAGIDLNSGFETAPGVKDASKLKEFMDKVRRER